MKSDADAVAGPLRRLSPRPLTRATMAIAAVVVDGGEEAGHRVRRHHETGA